MNKIHVIHMFIVKFMQENYHSGYVTFSLFDFRIHRYESKCIKMISEPYHISYDNGY